LDASFAPAWRPDVDDQLVGEVVALSEHDGGFGAYPIVTLRRDGGEEVAVHCIHYVLSSELAKLRPKAGDRLAIKFLGKLAKKSGTGSYNGYRVVSDAVSGGVNWAKYGDADDGDEETGGSDLPSDGAAVQPAVAVDDDGPLPF
jgi:hypothetical protein